MEKRKILVTSALPYANGDIHLGHLLEYIQTDIWVRFQRQMGNECHYICADDAHGAPIMLKAEQDGISPEELIAHYHKSHERDLRAFGVDFSNFYTTHSEENKKFSENIYTQLKENGYIVNRTISQLYDPVRGMFLADRYVKGECPQCGAPDQYGDSCEKCGSTYRATELINPVSVISGSKPEMRDSEHDFFDLPAFAENLQSWHQEGSIQQSVKNKLQEWFTEGLQAWDITRDAPYFGFVIPGHTDKYFYVWLDAPIGYIASFANLCEKNNEINFNEFWDKETATELYHFIGKDIIYFHTLFWPAMLEGANMRKPNGVFAHGFVSINGEKMSKSRGTFITAAKYLQHLNPEYLRYYFASKLGNGLDDIDLNISDFVQKVNSDIGGKLVNIASRCARFINSYFDNKLVADLGEYEDILQKHRLLGEEVSRLYEQRQYSQVIKLVMEIADHCNSIIDKKAPWKAIKENNNHDEVQQLCSAMIEHYWLMCGYLQPVLPELYKNSCDILFGRYITPHSITVHKLDGITIKQFAHLFKKVQNDEANKIIN